MIYYDGTSFTWQGRSLVGAVKGTNIMSFTYDDNGLRTSKTVNGVTTEYYWNGNLLVAEKTPYNLIVYNYDATGRPIGMAYRENGYTQYQWDVFWFDLNVFGDVVAVYDNNGTKLLTYTYDPWGYGEVGYVNGGEFSQAKRNRIAYRGYYYDSDLDLYYLQSRYYDPSTKRFISPDTIMSGANGSLQGFNLYVYCFNNPINMTDSQGNWPKWLETVIDVGLYIVSAVVSIVVAVEVTKITYNPALGVAIGLTTFSALNNATNAIYYNFISNGDSDLSSNSYNDGYVNRWDRLDYTKQEVNAVTGSSTYDKDAWLYFSEYNVHMYGWWALGWADGKSNIPKLSSLAHRAKYADIKVGKLDSEWWVKVPTILVGLGGL